MTELHLFFNPHSNYTSPNASNKTKWGAWKKFFLSTSTILPCRRLCYVIPPLPLAWRSSHFCLEISCLFPPDNSDTFTQQTYIHVTGQGWRTFTFSVSVLIHLSVKPRGISGSMYSSSLLNRLVKQACFQVWQFIRVYLLASADCRAKPRRRMSAVFFVSWISGGSLKVTFWPCITCSDCIPSTTAYTKVFLVWQGHAVYHSIVCWSLPAHPHRKEVSVKVSSESHMQQLDLLMPQHNP